MEGSTFLDANNVTSSAFGGMEETSQSAQALASQPLESLGDAMTAPAILPPLSSYSSQQERIEFALFVKILLKTLWKAKEYVLYQKVRMAIATCTTGNRRGDPNYQPLQDVLQLRILMLVGEDHLRRALNLRKIYLHKRNRQALQLQARRRAKLLLALSPTPIDELSATRIVQI